MTSTDGHEAAAAAEPPTLETVAAVAGVSRATVSRVINSSPKVSPQVREAVEAAIARTGYVPNRAARTLVTRRTDSVALVIQEPATRLFGDPYLSAIMRSVSAELADTDNQLVLMMVRTAVQQDRLERYLRGGHVDGALLVSLHGDDTLVGRLHASGMPVVVGGRPLGPAADFVYVDADNVGGARAAVEHLRGRGRRRIATIAGPQDMCAGVDRLRGYLDAVPGPALVAHGDFSRAGGAAAMRALLAEEPGLDAVFAASDLMALGAMAVLAEAGRRIPDDVAIVGFDDADDVAGWAEPALTTVRQNVEEQGRLMTRLLLHRIAGGAPADPAVLPTTLVARSSS
ncbi:LacI family DNA-binding transcriptional regulator [Embleya sp. NBC_00896]|uniref:LacI family DNA-binding transcriptional regulator n=1 Tax=Embleya sp. NBC_00896 TaxID=2975961 RepID=UPI0038655957|nr:LacI family transcriptional regulator [Embleya sp. NBC_00896]